AADLLMSNKEFNGADEIDIVNPGDVLAAGTGSPTESAADKPKQSVKNPARMRAHHHGAAKGDSARAWSFRGKKSALPAGVNVNAELPFAGNIRFISANLARKFVHGTIQSMAIDGSSAGVHPDARWM